jgi:hypothetical protein
VRRGRRKEGRRGEQGGGEGEGCVMWKRRRRGKEEGEREK